jgi:patatin-like phospholipase/acyl hydrolase
MPPYHILTLDGGGIRGVLTASLLERMEAEVPGFLEQVDLVAGTSTGGILSLALASGRTPTQARELYEHLGGAVFKDSLWDNIKDLGQITGAQYSNVPLKKELTNQFGDMKLGDLPKKVLISSFELDNHETAPGKVRMWKPKFFHNFPGPDSDESEKVVDVALYTSAAPTFFPVYHGYVDGGVIANNPSMCALAQALSSDSGSHTLNELHLLSIGTGVNPKYVEAYDNDWGLAQWGTHLISLIMEGSQGLADYQCRQALGEQYLRLNPVLPIPIGLDGLKEVPAMKEIAKNQDLSDVVKWLKSNFLA